MCCRFVPQCTPDSVSVSSPRTFAVPCRSRAAAFPSTVAGTKLRYRYTLRLHPAGPKTCQALYLFDMLGSLLRTCAVPGTQPIASRGWPFFRFTPKRPPVRFAVTAKKLTVLKTMENFERGKDLSKILTQGDKEVGFGKGYELNTVFAEADTQIDLSDFEEMIAEARKKARDVGLEKTDITNAISKARGKLK